MLLRKALKVLTRSQKGLFQSNQSLPLKDGLTTINGTSKTSKRIIDTVGFAGTFKDIRGNHFDRFLKHSKKRSITPVRIHTKKPPQAF